MESYGDLSNKVSDIISSKTNHELIEDYIMFMDKERITKSKMDE